MNLKHRQNNIDYAKLSNHLFIVHEHQQCLNKYYKLLLSSRLVQTNESINVIWSIK